jgi:hypothetical protein
MQAIRVLHHADTIIIKALTFQALHSLIYRLRFKNAQIWYPVMYLNGNSPMV